MNYQAIRSSTNYYELRLGKWSELANPQKFCNFENSINI